MWTHWISTVSPFDLSWKNIIYNIQPKILSFVLNSMINSLATPDMLKLWNLRGDASCYLCNHSPCTLHHILVHCPNSLLGKRYSWRHDSVLFTLQPLLVGQITQYNTRTPITPHTLTPIKFTTSGHHPPTSRKRNRPTRLSEANDWRLLIDYDTAPILFPPEIIASNKRPDIIIWSVSIKCVILFELTCGAEE